MSRPTRNPSSRSLYCLISRKFGGSGGKFDLSVFSFQTPTMRGAGLLAGAWADANVVMRTMAAIATQGRRRLFTSHLQEDCPDKCIYVLQKMKCKLFHHGVADADLTRLIRSGAFRRRHNSSKFERGPLH